MDGQTDQMFFEVFCSIPHPRPPSVIMSDTSNTGWGAHLDQVTFGGHWAFQEKSLQINALELRAIHLALRSFLPDIQGSMVQVATDNMAAIYYVNKQAGAHSFQLCAKSSHTV